MTEWYSSGVRLGGDSTLSAVRQDGNKGRVHKIATPRCAKLVPNSATNRYITMKQSYGRFFFCMFSALKLTGSNPGLHALQRNERGPLQKHPIKIVKSTKTHSDICNHSIFTPHNLWLKEAKGAVVAPKLPTNEYTATRASNEGNSSRKKPARMTINAHL